ncbi:MAG TPA: MFS transporter [Ktedonobacterales bacterium]|nr:MFS transporter [Ktedonobacterales bacterium]
MHRRGLWHNRAFLSLWAGETVSMIGSAVTELALPLTAILLLHATPWQLGVLLALETVATAGLSLFVGAWSDRVRRRPLMIAADIGRALLVASVPVALVLGWLRIEWLYAVAVLIGALDALFSSAYQGFFPNIVPEEDLVGANGRLEGSRNFAQIIGPGLAGALIQAFQAPFALFIDAASFLASAFSVAMIRGAEVNRPARGKRGNLWREIGQGLSMTFGQPLLRTMLIVVVIFNFFAPMLNAQLALFAVRVLGLTPLLLGLQIVAVGMCGVLAAFITGAVTKRLGMGPTMVLATLLISSGWLSVATLQRSWPATLLLMILGASVGTTGDVLININAATLRQLLTPDHLRGRVGATMRLFILGAQPLGALIGGVVGATFGVRAAIFCAGGGFFLGFLAAFFSPLRALSQAPASVQTPAATPLVAE